MSLQEKPPKADSIEQVVMAWLNKEENPVKAKDLDGGWEG